MSRLAVVIPTLDEAIHIRRAVESALPLGQVFVVDSGSTDGTPAIAEDAGARVVVHAWEGYSTQKNWALDNLPLTAEWVLFLDADEYLTPEARASILAATGTNRFAGYYLPRRNIFLGRLLRYAWWYPDYQLRLFKAKRGRWEDRLVHEQVLLNGRAGFLSEPLMHENLKGIDAFIRRHERYADFEAQEILSARRGQQKRQRRGRFFGTWPERRRSLKTQVWYRLRGRPAIRFFWTYVLKRGFLDGRQGLVYCQLLGAYEALIDAKLLELELTDAVVTAGNPLDLQTLLVCPICQGRLVWGATESVCSICAQAYPIVEGIPVMLTECVAAEHDELDHHGSHDHRGRQMAYFDSRVAEEFEITRPHGTPALYTWFYKEKFRRSLVGLRASVAGRTALTVCGGSGMDGEFLARAGARVIVSDLSLGAAKRAQQRARRYGLAMLSIVADVERLPFKGGAIDLVYVHDGLHHLPDPLAGLREMARVAAHSVSLTEPARALATVAAVRAGWAMDVEEAGNRVARLDPRQAGDTLRSCGFRVTQTHRYVLYHQHEPGVLMQLLSLPGLFAVARFAWCAANALVGRVGNKLSIVAERARPSTGSR